MEEKLEATRVPTKTLIDRVGRALELTVKIKELLRISSPQAGEGVPSSSKISEAKVGLDLINDNLVQIVEAVSEI